MPAAASLRRGTFCPIFPTAARIAQAHRPGSSRRLPARTCIAAVRRRLQHMAITCHHISSHGGRRRPPAPPAIAPPGFCPSNTPAASPARRFDAATSDAKAPLAAPRHPAHVQACMRELSHSAMAASVYKDVLAAQGSPSRCVVTCGHGPGCPCV